MPLHTLLDLELTVPDPEALAGFWAGLGMERTGATTLGTADRPSQLRLAEGTYRHVSEMRLGCSDESDLAAIRERLAALGVDAVVVAALRGGRVPEDRATLVPWGAPSPGGTERAPWPGQLRAPSPATTLAHPVAVQLRDTEDRPVVMGSRGLLSASPATLLFSNQSRREVAWHAGPWPLVERWWAMNRRRAHVQVLLASGEALLVCAESSLWWLVGIYD